MNRKTATIGGLIIISIIGAVIFSHTNKTPQPSYYTNPDAVLHRIARTDANDDKGKNVSLLFGINRKNLADIDHPDSTKFCGIMKNTDTNNYVFTVKRNRNSYKAYIVLHASGGNFSDYINGSNGMHWNGQYNYTIEPVYYNNLHGVTTKTLPISKKTAFSKYHGGSIHMFTIAEMKAAVNNQSIKEARDIATKPVKHVKTNSDGTAAYSSILGYVLTRTDFESAIENSANHIDKNTPILWVFKDSAGSSVFQSQSFTDSQTGQAIFGPTYLIKLWVAPGNYKFYAISQRSPLAQIGETQKYPEAEKSVSYSYNQIMKVGKNAPQLAHPWVEGGTKPTQKEKQMQERDDESQEKSMQ